MNSPVLACFGKVPTHGDFVRHRASSPAWRLLDEGVQRGLLAARRAQGRAFKQAFRDMSPLHFVMVTPGSLLCGAIHPSSDKAGRAYPMIVGMELSGPPQEEAVVMVPLRWAPALRRMARLAERAANGEWKPYELIDRLKDQDLVPDPRATATGDAFLRKTNLEEFSSLLWDDFDDARKYLVFKNILESFPGEGQDPSLNGKGVTFPLGPSADNHPQLILFWLSLVHRLSSPDTGVDMYFWDASPDAEEDRSNLMLFEDARRGQAFELLFGGSAAQGQLMNLQEDGQQKPADIVLSLPPEIGSLLEDGSATLQKVLRGV